MDKIQQNHDNISVNRFRLFLAQNKLTQSELGKRINKTQQQISQIATGKIKLSPVIALEIASLYPEKDLLAEWLLGDSQFQSTNEKYISDIKDSQITGELEFTTIFLIAQLSGYEVVMSADREETEPLSPVDSSVSTPIINDIDPFFSEGVGYSPTKPLLKYAFYKKGVYVELSHFAMLKLQKILASKFEEVINNTLGIFALGFSEGFDKSNNANDDLFSCFFKDKNLTVAIDNENFIID